MAESVNALYKTELHRNPAALAANGGHWKGLDDLEVATCAWCPGSTRSASCMGSWTTTHRLRSEDPVLPCPVPGHRGMREPTERVSVKPRPNQSAANERLGCAWRGR